MSSESAWSAESGAGSKCLLQCEGGLHVTVNVCKIETQSKSCA